MRGTVTLGGGLPYLKGQLFVYLSHVKGRGRATLLRGTSLAVSDYCHIAARLFKI